MSALAKLVADVVEDYNRYRSPEAVATVKRLEGRILSVRFKGPFCASCGIIDWFEDLGYELKSRDPEIQFAIVGVEQTGDEAFTVDFELKQA